MLGVVLWKKRNVVTAYSLNAERQGMCSDRQSDRHDVSVKNIRLGNLCLAADSVTKRSIVVMP